MPRYEFVPDGSHVLARMHAFLHKATASTNAVTGWFDVDDEDAMIGGPVAGVAEVDVRAFEFGNPLLAAAARRWIDEGASSTLRFDLEGAKGTGAAADIVGMLTIGERAESVTATAEVRRNGDRVTIRGTWPLSQKAFGLSRPPGVKDRVDIDFTLVAAPA